jgi:hypothetical protein
VEERGIGAVAVIAIVVIIATLASYAGYAVNAAQTTSNLSSKNAIQDMTTSQVPHQVTTQAIHSCQAQIEIIPQCVPPASALPSVMQSGIVTLGTPPLANWVEQLGLSFTQDFTSLAENVTAVEQADVDGHEPTYLLNGLSSSGYWYQVGFWAWSVSPSFHFTYEVFDSTGSSVLGPGGGDFSGTVNQGDTVGLYLYFSNENVIMYGYDFNTGASAQASYSAEGATYFTGTPNAMANSNGFFTGLMTEWWHVSPYYGGEASVHYSNSTFALSSAWMWIDEFNYNTRQILFFADTSSPVSYSNPTQLQSFSSNGATEASDAYEFITGTGSWASMALNYSVVNGGTGFNSPTLTYVYGGTHTQYTTGLITFPTTYCMDPGSVWSVSNPLPGSSGTERWSTKQQTSGVASSNQTIKLVYYHQYLVVYSYSIGGGGNPAPPVLDGTSFGTSVSLIFGTASASVWLDAGTSYAFDSLLNASTTDRWITNQASTSGTISAPATFSPAYTHQFYVEMESDSVAGGSVTPASDWFNTGRTVQISATANPGWEFESWNGSGTTSFSGASNSTTVSIDSPIVEYATFYPGLTINVTNYGTVTYSYSLGSDSVPSNTSKVLYVPLNTNIDLTANPTSSYIFQFKQWSGATASTDRQVSIIVSAPTTVQADFGFNWVNIGITIAVIAGGLVVLTVLILQRRGPRIRKKRRKKHAKTFSQWFFGR